MMFLSEQFKDKITYCVDKNIISEKDVFQLWKSKDEKQLIRNMSNLINIDTSKKSYLWKIIIDNYWNTVDEVFGKNEIMLLKLLINSSGIILREDISKSSSFFKNNYGINNAVKELEYLEVVEKIKISNSKVLYMISSKLLIEVNNNVK